MSVEEKDAKGQPEATVGNSQRGHLTRRAIDAIFGHQRVHQIEQTCPVCGQNHQLNEPCRKIEGGNGTIQGSANEVLELINTVKKIQETQQQILAQTEQKAKSYADKLAKVRLAAAKRTVRIQQELETKARDYADSIIKAKAEALESLAKQKEKFEGESTEKIAIIESQANEKIAKLQLQLETNTKEYGALLKEAKAKVQLETQKINEYELKLNSADEKLARLEQELNITKQNLLQSEEIIKTEQQARAEAETKIEQYGEVIQQERLRRETEAKIKLEFQEKFSEAQKEFEKFKTAADEQIEALKANLTEAGQKFQAELMAKEAMQGQIEKISSDAQSRIESVKAEAANTVESIKAEATKEIEQLKTDMQMKAKELENLLEESKSKEQAISQMQQEITALKETAKAAETLGTCECCGKNNIKSTELVRIDSGQLFCPDCLKALRGD